MKTNELTGAALDWAVAICEGAADIWQAANGEWCIEINGKNEYFDEHEYSTNWSKGGPIIERERISITKVHPAIGSGWGASKPAASAVGYKTLALGPTPLIAAMRCFVASKLGEEVEIPEELK